MRIRLLFLGYVWVIVALSAGCGSNVTPGPWDAGRRDAADGGVETDVRTDASPADSAMDAIFDGPSADVAADSGGTDASGDGPVAIDGAGVCRTNGDCAPTEYCAGSTCDGPGTCTARPGACPAVFDPVCGCDGRTYSNACVAASAGVRVAYRGECRGGTDGGTDGSTSACTSNRDCDPITEYCAFPLGVCGGTGMCVPRPDRCSDVYSPVCGCDGITYLNECRAGNAGVSLRSIGPCGGGSDGGTTTACSSNADCARGQYCQFPLGVCGGTGMCVLRPGACPLVYDPVCGCDGRTYGNSCEAAAAGVSVRSRGPCPSVDAGVVDGGGGSVCRSNMDCSSTQYCALPPGVCIGTGTCTPRPTVCPLIYRPVCGCDGRTYDNSCEAARAGVNVRSEGVCSGVDGDGVCRSNADCAITQYCQFPSGVCGGTGMCVLRPDRCSDVYSPVCGCDGMTYTNECRAGANGVSVRSVGPCAGGSDGGTTTACRTNADCSSTQYCALPPGVCIGTGTCTPRPGACSLVYDPVCGCDGRTYVNSCEAARAGVNIQYGGECRMRL